QELLRSLGVRRRDRGGEGDVGRVELAVEHAADQREREAPPAQLPDALQPLEVLGAVPRDPSLADRRSEQSALLIEANRVDRGLGPPGEVLDAETVGRHESDSRSVCSQNRYRGGGRGSGAYVLRQTGRRFSANAVAPSTASPLSNTGIISSRVRVQPSASLNSAASRTRRRELRTAIGEFSPIRFARSVASSTTRSAGTTRLTRPSWS